MATKTDSNNVRIINACFGVEDEEDNKKGLTPVIPIEVNLPKNLKVRAFKSENSVNLLNVATIIYNSGLSEKPQTGFGHIVIFLKNEKMEYDFRVHSVSFNPTIDLEDTKLMAEISTTDNKMVQRLITDKVLSFYITGKLTETSEKEVETIVINKIIPHVDQTVYAKKFEAVKKKDGVYCLPDVLIKEEIFHDPEWDGVKMKGVTKIWEEFSKEYQRDFNKSKTLPTDPKQSTFDKWRKAIKSKKV